MGPRTPDLFRFGFEILNVMSMSVEIFIRHSFGERYVNWIRFIFSLLMLQSVLGILRFFGALPFIGTGNYPTVSSYFWYSFVGLTIYHLFRIWWRNKKGIPWHSRSFGISHLSFLPFNDNVLYRVVEPMACLTVSWLLHPISPFTANWLLVSSFCLLIKNNLLYNIQRGRVLDLIDGRIEAAVMAGTMEGTDKRKTAGWSNIVTMPQDLDSVPKDHAADEATTISSPQDFAATVAALMEGTDMASSRLDDGASDADTFNDDAAVGAVTSEDQSLLPLSDLRAEGVIEPQNGAPTHDLHSS